MKRRHFLAAELFAYSFDNYRSHLAVENLRFTKYMPADVELLERAESEAWSDGRVANELDVPLDQVAGLKQRYRRAKAIVDATTPAEAFRRGVRYSIEDAVEEGLTSADDIERLVGQVCYRAADLSLLLDLEGSTLSEYSAALRTEPDSEIDADE
jgi:hypothetical protein